MVSHSTHLLLALSGVRWTAVTGVRLMRSRILAICKKRLTSDHEVVKGEMPVVCKKWLTGVILNMCRSVQNRVEQAVVAQQSNSLPSG